MKLDIFQVIDDQKKCCQKEILFSLTGFVIFILFIIFLLPDDQKLFAITSITILIAVMLYKNVKTLIYFCNLLKHPNIDLQKSLNNTIFYSKENYVITNNSIINLSIPIEQIFYDDIIYIYKCKVHELDTIGKKEILHIYLRNGINYKFCIKPSFPNIGDIETIDFSNIILEKNPNVLVGETDENKQILLEKYGIKI